MTLSRPGSPVTTTRPARPRGQAHALSGIPWETQYSSRVLVRGVTERRERVVAKGVVHIGKEADRWEERFLLGDDPDAEVVDGSAKDEHAERRTR